MSIDIATLSWVLGSIVTTSGVLFAVFKGIGKVHVTVFKIHQAIEASIARHDKTDTRISALGDQFLTLKESVDKSDHLHQLVSGMSERMGHMESEMDAMRDREIERLVVH